MIGQITTYPNLITNSKNFPVIKVLRLKGKVECAQTHTLRTLDEKRKVAFSLLPTCFLEETIGKKEKKSEGLGFVLYSITL